MALSAYGKVRFCGYGDFVRTTPLKGIKGLKRFDCSRNPVLLKVLSDLNIRKVFADRSATQALLKLKVFSTPKNDKYRQTDEKVLAIATAAKVHTLLFYPKQGHGVKTAVFIAEPDNIRTIMPIKGKSILLSINSPFEPGLVNDSIESGKEELKTVPIHVAFKDQIEQYPITHDTIRLIARDLLEMIEVPVPKGSI